MCNLTSLNTSETALSTLTACSLLDFVSWIILVLVITKQTYSGRCGTVSVWQTTVKFYILQGKSEHSTIDQTLSFIRFIFLTRQLRK